MLRPPNPELQEGVEVTPDAVIQPTDRYGLIAETKKNFPVSAPNEPYNQIAKYDCALKGWWTTDETIPVHDLALLTHVASSVDAVDAYAAWQESGRSFDRAFAIVEFGWIEMGKSWFLLRRVEGSLSDRAHDEALRRGKKIPYEVMVEILNRFKFVDHQPPLMHMLVLIFNYIFPLFPKETEFERETGGRYPVLMVSASQIRDRLDEQFCPKREDTRQFKLPKLEWVEDAMAAFVRMGIAVRMPDRSKAYRVSFKRPPTKDVVEYFAKKLASADKPKPTSADQTEMFREVPERGDSDAGNRRIRSDPG